MGFLLAVVGALLLLLSLAGVALGLFIMSLDHRTREPGLYFVLWWIPAVAAASGILMADPATFAISAFCFVVAGTAFALERRGFRGRLARSKRRGSRGAKKRPRSEEAERQLSETEKHWPSEKAKR